MLNANDRMNWAQKAKITAYLRQIGRLNVPKGKYTPYTKTPLRTFGDGLRTN